MICVWGNGRAWSAFWRKEKVKRVRASLILRLSFFFLGFRKVFFFFFLFMIFFNIMLTWKIVGVSKASVIYI